MVILTFTGLIFSLWIFNVILILLYMWLKALLPSYKALWKVILTIAGILSLSFLTIIDLKFVGIIGLLYAFIAIFFVFWGYIIEHGRTNPPRTK